MVFHPGCPMPSPNCGFDGGSFVGGMVLIAGIVLLLVAGYFGYKWWQKSNGYEAINH